MLKVNDIRVIQAEAFSLGVRRLTEFSTRFTNLVTDDWTAIRFRSPKSFENGFRDIAVTFSRSDSVARVKPRLRHESLGDEFLFVISRFYLEKIPLGIEFVNSQIIR